MDAARARADEKSEVVVVGSSDEDMDPPGAPSTSSALPRPPPPVPRLLKSAGKEPLANGMESTALLFALDHTTRNGPVASPAESQGLALTCHSSACGVLYAIGVFDEAKLRDAGAHVSLVAAMLNPSLKPPDSVMVAWSEAYVAMGVVGAGCEVPPQDVVLWRETVLGADRVKKMGWENTGCMMKEVQGCALWEKAGFVAWEV
jgi:hypothetical protein